MALSTLLLVAIFLGAYALYKYWDTSRRHRIPRGLKPLPGPKGMTLCHRREISPAINSEQPK
jgi:hypothetical protein